MKKIDKLILSSFIGPFILTTVVVVFILLLQTMLRYFEDFFGKGISVWIFVEMFFYFALNVTPVALPLAVLLSSLMTYGNLGEHYELTAIKSSGISLTRTLLPIFIFVIGLTFTSFVFNDKIVPKANLRAYSVLWDVRQKKPSMSLIEGGFYNGIPNYSIYVKKIVNDSVLRGLYIYDHSTDMGNTKLIIADSGIMKTINNERDLSLKMYRGKMFFEGENQRPGENETFMRSNFKEMTTIFSLISFQMNRTQKEMFANNRQMKNIKELDRDADSIRKINTEVVKELNSSIKAYFSYNNTPRVDTLKSKIKMDSVRRSRSWEKSDKEEILTLATNNARTVKSLMVGYSERFYKNRKEANSYEIQKTSKYTQAFACLVMFLIGAPLGAIIKKGGLGMPVLISIAFFIAFYVLTILFEKWGKEGFIQLEYASWAPNAILLPIGLFFLKQARNDARLFDADAYNVFWSRFKKRFFRKKELNAAVA